MAFTDSSKTSTVSSKTTNSSHPALFSFTNPTERYYRTAYTTSNVPHRAAEQTRLFDIECESTSQIRRNALNTLFFCRNVIAHLELTRLRKSRVGFANWLSFWERIYRLDLAHKIATRVALARHRIDQLFRNVAAILRFQTQGCENFVAFAESGNHIIQAAVALEGLVRLWCRRRRKRARYILDLMRESLERIPLVVSDDFFTDLKRAVFGLTESGEYHPGDSEAEAREQRYRLLVWPCGQTRHALSPRFYRAFQERFVRALPYAFDDTSRQEAMLQQFERYHIGGTDNSAELTDGSHTSVPENDRGLSHGHPVRA